MLKSAFVEPCRSAGAALVFIFLVVVMLLGGSTPVRGQQIPPRIVGEETVFISLESYNPRNQSTWSIHTLSPQSRVVVTVEKAPSDIRFYIFQAHAHLHNISLSYNQTLIQHNYITGTNLGLVWKTNEGQGSFYVTNPNPENVTVMYAIVAYGAYSPVPGGCNMEFEVETAPYLKVWYSSAMVEVNAQPALAPGSSCTKDLVTHDMYHMFMDERNFTEESYFDAIKAMLTPDKIIENGLLAPVPIYGSIMRRLYSLYAGTGSVYVVVARTQAGTSAYVPAVSYGCSALFFSDSCSVLKTTFSKVLCASILFLGLFACFGGHTFFKSQVFLAGCLSGSLSAYVALSQLTNFPFGSGVTLSCLLGLAIGAACLLVWYFCGIPVIAILFLAVPLGFLMASLTFFVGLGDVQFAQMDLDFWLAFVLLLLSTVLLILPLLHHASMLSCAVVGAYAAVVPIDYYAGTSLKYIIINSLRRASVPGFSLAIVVPPFAATDVALCVLWVVLAVVGFGVQQKRQDGRPPFPPASRGPPPLSLPRHCDGGAGAPTARTPIRVSSRIPYSYGSVGDDDVFETPPGAGAGATANRPASRIPYSIVDWFGRGCGLRGR